MPVVAPPASVKKTSVVAPAVAFDEELWFGDSSPRDAETAAAQSMAAAAGAVVGAKPFPAAARRLAELARQETTTTSAFVQVLEQDPGLSARLLRVVNSAGFGLRQPCATIRHAVTLVGTEHLYRLATTAVVLNMFDTSGAHAVGVLEHSAAVAAICRYVSVHVTMPAEEMFTIGMLHDIGKLMLLEAHGEQYAELLDKCAGVAEGAYLQERTRFGFDHGVLAAHVLKEWNIPNPIPKIVAWHHEPARALKSSGNHGAMVQVLRLADALEQAMNTGAEAEQFESIAKQQAATYLEISEAQLMSMLGELRELHANALAHARGESDQELPATARSGTRKVAGTEASADVPRQFPCVSCGNPTFAAACEACRGHVCSEHPLNAAGWCRECEAEHQVLQKQELKPLVRWRSIVMVVGFGGIFCALAAKHILFSEPVRSGLTGSVVGGLLVASRWLVARARLRAQFKRTRQAPRVWSPKGAA